MKKGPEVQNLWPPDHERHPVMAIPCRIADIYPEALSR